MTEELQCPILAVDPGKRTGIAYIYRQGQVYDGEIRFESREVDFDNVGGDLEGIIETYRWMQLRVVTERFIITIHTGKNSQAPWSLKVNGILEYLARIKHNLPYHEQSASEAKTFSGNEVLKLLGWYRAGMPHANDAARHLLVYAVSRKLFTSDKLKQLF